METEKTKTEILKETILSQYRSVRQFAVRSDIPYSTLVTALDRGIEGMGYETVIRMCEVLSLNPIDFRPLQDGDRLSLQIETRRVMSSYNKLNEEGRRRILSLLNDYAMIPAYTEKEGTKHAL
ncbi:MAG: transcriptional regulator [Lachnospiraceae bacterium]|nr:transcriptional regulator [Lachnospiraceae bacterium]